MNSPPIRSPAGGSQRQVRRVMLLGLPGPSSALFARAGLCAASDAVPDSAEGRTYYTRMRASSVIRRRTEACFTT